MPLVGSQHRKTSCTQSNLQSTKPAPSGAFVTIDLLCFLVWLWRLCASVFSHLLGVSGPTIGPFWHRKSVSMILLWGGANKDTVYIVRFGYLVSGNVLLHSATDVCFGRRLLATVCWYLLATLSGTFVLSPFVFAFAPFGNLFPKDIEWKSITYSKQRKVVKD